MSVLVPSDRSIRVAAGVAAVLFALSVSAQSRPLGPQVPAAYGCTVKYKK